MVYLQCFWITKPIFYITAWTYVGTQDWEEISSITEGYWISSFFLYFICPSLILYSLSYEAETCVEIHWPSSPGNLVFRQVKRDGWGGKNTYLQESFCTSHTFKAYLT